ncbi:hypothetical protein RHSIM_Rhsim01G0109000 [Rhododendron simsii]|uniref:RWP-RK domain-containing protein n=1 Tax=Rhododendron simsii TaxID=118357 RepID=A0A834LYN0_RHOSS|nr:hypothetical protein RHSIM_Rhsim01G0109000 [Rhododendron simsii]
MADEPPSSPIIPYLHSLDDHDISLFDDILMLDEIPSLNLAESPLLMQPDDSVPVNPVGSGTPHSTATTGTSQEVPTSELRGETSHQRGILQPDISGFGNPVPLPVWPAPPVPFTCSCCQVLREIIHTKGNHLTRLEIHGRLGLISHAILENRFFSSDWITTQSQYHQMLDFSKKSIEAVKEYLVQYCEGRKQDGYTMQKDPLLTFYEALCVGLINGDHDSFDTDDFFQPSLGNSGENQGNQPEPLNQIGAKRDEVRLSLGEQRERTGKLTLRDLMGYFHLPIEEAAREMKVCPTVMKKISRKHGLKRWPHRKIKSIEKKISTRRQSLNGNDAEERARAQCDIESFQQELASMYRKATDAEMS